MSDRTHTRAVAAFLDKQQETTMPKQIPSVESQLENMLVQSAKAAGVELSVMASESTHWASVTFTGSRHLLTVCAPASEELDAWLASILEMDDTIQGHLIADLIVQSERRENGTATVQIEALTVRDNQP